MKNKKVFILGMARSGFEAAKLLAKDNEVWITDIKEQNEQDVRILKELGVKYIITNNPTNLLDESFDLLVKNPGIRKDHQTVEKARNLQIPVINELELAYQYLHVNTHIIGITGSNGKTTTATLIYKFLCAAGKSAFLGGNIGIPFCQFVLDVKENDYIVLEVSDHQLCDVKNFKTNISILTNLYPVHLDFHDSFDQYKEMKKRIFAHHTKEDIAIINKDNEESLKIIRDILSSKQYFSKNHVEDCYLKNDAIYYQKEKIMDTKDILLKGSHNYENIMAAILAVKAYHVSNEAIKSVLTTFKGVEHRIEFVKNIKGVSYYNDSKATNCESTKIALKSFQNPTLLILGGLDRGHSFEDLKDFMQNVKYVACYGETKNRIEKYCKSMKIPCDRFENLKEATLMCYQKAEKNDVVLLSPACASWDQYDSFETRGNEFKKIVGSLGEK